VNLTCTQSRRSFLLSCSASVLTIGCGAVRSNAGFYMLPDQTDTLTLYDIADPPTLDPARSWGFLDGRLTGLIFSNLIRFDHQAKITPDLASQWNVSKDGLCYRFNLNPAAKFSNGRPVTANDVRYSLERVRDPKVASPSGWVVERVSQINVINEHAIELQLKEPFAPFINLLAMPAASIVPKEEITRCEQQEIPFGEHPVGSGPWLLKEWRHDQHILFERNKAYWSQKPKISKFKIQIISNPFTAIAEFETGRLAAINPTPIVEIPRWRNHPQWRDYTHRAQTLNTDMIIFNCGRSPLNKVKVRQALCQAVDAELLLECVREGAGSISAGPIPPGLDGNQSQNPQLMNPSEITQTLDQSGLLERGIDLIMPARENFTRTTGEAIQAIWKQTGIPVRLRRLEWVTYRQALREGRFDAAYRGWFADYPDGDNFLHPLFHSSQIGQGNMSRFSDAETDQLIEKSQREFDQQTRKSLLQEANAMVYQKAPALFLWHQSKYIVSQPWLRGYSEPLIFNGTRFLEEEIVLPKPSGA